MAKEKITDAEKYRRERKKRINKEKKKKNSYVNRNRQQVEKAEKIIGIVVGAIAVLAIVYGFLNFFGVFNRIIPAADVKGEKVSVAMMNCAYADVKNQVYNQSQQYKESYGQEFYTSDTKSTDSCVYDSTKTWGQYFEEQALKYVQQVYAFKDAQGNELTSDQVSEINSTFTSLAKSASSNEYSLGAYIKQVYGTGVNKSVLREWLTDVYKAQNAQKRISSDYTKKLTDKEIKAYYEKNKATYMTASVEAYTISVDTSAYTKQLSATKLTNAQIDKIIASAVKSADSKATELFNKIKANPSSFASLVSAYEKSNKKSGAKTYKDSDLIVKGKIAESMTSLSSAARTWITNGDSAGTIKLVYGKDYDNKTFQYDIVLIKTPAVAFTTVNVRHILLQPSDTSKASSWKETKEKADTLYAKWKKTPTETNFSTLAKSNSADTGSTDNGGLYEDVYPGQMVTAFNDWCFNSARKKGDTGIVKSSYGYHIMYFVKNNGLYWKANVPTTMAEEYVNNTVEDTLSDAKVSKHNFGWKKVKGVKDYADEKKTTTTTTTTKASSK